MDTQQNNAEDEMDSYEERKFEKELMEAYVKHDVLWKHPPGHTPSKEIEILQNQAWQTVATSLSRSMGRIYEGKNFFPVVIALSSLNKKKAVCPTEHTG